MKTYKGGESRKSLSTFLIAPCRESPDSPPIFRQEAGKVMTMPTAYTDFMDMMSGREDAQSDPEPGQVPNKGGGFAFPVDDWKRLERFLILGSEKGSYYTNERTLTMENAGVVLRCLKEDYLRTIGTATGISYSGRAPKNDPAIFVMALAMAQGEQGAKDYVRGNISAVCRTGTHMYQFVAYVNKMRGWGPSFRKTVAEWYTDQSEKSLASQFVKYRSRKIGDQTWTHRDILRLTHPKARTTEQNTAFQWATKGAENITFPESLWLIEGYQKASTATSAADVAKLITEYGLPHEAVPTDYRTSPEVWEALLPYMGATALLRNCSTMTRVGLLDNSSKATRFVVSRLTDPGFLKKGRIHPMNVLFAQRTYASGMGFQGRSTWSPVSRITEAMESAFYQTFDFVEPTGKRFMIGLDVSGSMSHAISGSPLSCREAGAALSLVTMAVEEDVETHVFSGGGGWGNHTRAIKPAPFSRGSTLKNAMALTARMPFSTTDCSLPMRWAKENKREFDVFVVITDSETNSNQVAPHIALQQYRETMGIPAKLVVIAMVANEVSIADPNDGGMLDVCGFDTSVPSVLRDFVME